MNPLQQFVHDTMKQKKIDKYEVERRAKAAGEDVSFQTVQNVLDGLSALRKTKAVRKGMAAGLDVPLGEIERLSEESKGLHTRATLPEFDGLSEENQAAIRALTRALRAQQDVVTELTARLARTEAQADTLTDVIDDQLDADGDDFEKLHQLRQGGTLASFSDISHTS